MRLFDECTATASVEEVILLLTVVIGLAAALLTLAPALLRTHNLVEIVLWLPFP